ncbi:unnamed protein product [Brachionus calyciflorus]|uniref:Uncharacterized protein n=1 Tax=Brachionus calyciflorus TaxID=104777 RepID=A0A813Q3V4_9BILA|nr:unnamed protein product [Brachionus calyciflorus]
MLTTAIETIPKSVALTEPTLLSNLKLIKISDKIYNTNSTPKKPIENLKKNVILSTSSESSMDETQNNEIDTNKCSSNINLKDIYNSLNEIDDSNTKEILNDYFFNDNFIYEPNTNQTPVSSTKPILPKAKNRNFEFNEWYDGLCDWQTIHSYPSFKAYIQNFKNKLKNKRNELEFDQELGFYVPVFKLKPPQQLQQQQQQQQTQKIITNPANLNTLNNMYASNKLMRELNKLAMNQSEYGRRSSSATSNKRCLSIKPAALPFSLSTENNFYSHLQIRSDELDRQKNQTKNYRLDYKNLNAKLAQEHLSSVKATNQMYYDQNDEDDMRNKFLYHKSESDTILKNFGSSSNSYLLNNNHSLSNINSNVLRVSSLSVNNGNQLMSTNEILEKHRFYLDNSDVMLNEQVNNEIMTNQMYLKSNYQKSKKIGANNKPLGVNTGSNSGLYLHNSPKSDVKNADGMELNVTNSMPSSGNTSLPPIISGKRINLPLGQHRYAQYHRPNKAHLYKITV